MTTRSRLAVLVGCAVVALVVALCTAGRAQPRPAVAAGSVFLGPTPGEPIAAYLAHVPATLPAAGTTALALVAFATGRTTAAAEQGAPTPVEAVFRVDLPHVQTALRFEPLEAPVPVPTALDSARQRAASAAATDAVRLGGRSQAVASAEAAALTDRSCACVVAMVVSGDGAALRALAARSGVRAVEAAPAATTLPELALSPLLPEQTVRADPLPDDGPVPG